MEDLVRAAGGLVWRSPARDRLALVRRERHGGDWSLPKGKLEPGEAWEAAALREVEEETGWRARPLGFAGTVRYLAGGRPKEVRFWHMLAEEKGDAQPDGEVAEVRFVSPEEALRLLTHETERQLLREAVAGTPKP